MPRKVKEISSHHAKKPIEQYDHKDKKRANNPPVGLVKPETDPDMPAKQYAYDPHLDPQLVWAGKAERTSFDVPTVSLHVHERIDPRTIIEAVRKRNGNGQPVQGSFLFESKAENPPLREAIDFYKHPHGWSNRLIAGDSLLVMNSLLEKEGMAGKVQMVYIDPPYGIKYGSNFQPFVSKRDVKDGKDEDLTQEPEMIRAFRDTWELGIHSYLSYLRDRLWLAKDLLRESGSCFVQISDENVHHIRELLDDVFDAENFCGMISFAKTSSASGKLLSSVSDYLLWYCKQKEQVKYNQIYLKKEAGEAGGTQYTWAELSDGTRKNFQSFQRLKNETPAGARVFRQDNLTSQRPAQENDVREFFFEGRRFTPGRGTFKTDLSGLENLKRAKRLIVVGNTLSYVRFLDDFPVFPITNTWDDTATSGFAAEKRYVVQTTPKVIERCLLMTSDPGDLVLDPTCGSGTTAYVAEQWGRRWVTCDTSRVAITLAKQRLMTALYDYYDLAHPDEGVGSGFKYKTVPHITLKSIANNEPPDQETLYDQPSVDNKKARVSGPFTVEAVPGPTVKSISEVSASPPGDEAAPVQIGLDGKAPPQQVRLLCPARRAPADVSVARSGETLRQSEWRDVLLRGGVRGKGGQAIEFSRIEPLGGTRWVHADAQTKGVKPERVAVSFGPEYAPLEQKQVELAWEEARQLSPRPSILLFVYSDVDPEAGKDIAELTPAKTGMTFLAAKIDADVWTKDLKKKARTSPSVWLVGQPDIELRRVAPPFRAASAGATKNAGLKPGATPGPTPGGTLWQVEIHGFDYYNTSTGKIESGETKNIALWLLDTDYDGRSLYARQVFFPMADEDEGWAKLAKNLKAEIDPELIKAYRGTVSLPFEPGKYSRIAVKIVDDRGIESLKVVEVV
jgi:adenine-specific DNA-methyltransferase